MYIRNTRNPFIHSISIETAFISCSFRRVYVYFHTSLKNPIYGLKLLGKYAFSLSIEHRIIPLKPLCISIIRVNIPVIMSLRFEPEFDPHTPFTPSTVCRKNDADIVIVIE